MPPTQLHWRQAEEANKGMGNCAPVLHQEMSKRPPTQRAAMVVYSHALAQLCIVNRNSNADLMLSMGFESTPPLGASRCNFAAIQQLFNFVACGSTAPFHQVGVCRG